MSGIMIIFVVKLDAAVAQLVEHQLPKLRVASSSLVYRSDADKGHGYKPMTFNFVPMLTHRYIRINPNENSPK